MANLKISEMIDGTPVVASTDYFPIVRGGSNYKGLLQTSTITALLPSGIVTSVFGRPGATITAQTGDYTAAQVTNAADKNISSTQLFNGNLQTPALLLKAITSGDIGTLSVPATLGQTTAYNIPDPGVVSTNFILSDSSAGSQNINGMLTITDDWTGSFTSPALLLRGKTDNNKQLYMGLDTNVNVGIVRAVWEGVEDLELKLNPITGFVSVGLTLLTPAQSVLDVVGDLSLGIIATPSTPRASTGKVYPKSDGNLYFLNASNVETNLCASGSVSPLTTKGDVWGYSTTNARIPIGTNGQVLTADSTQALGLKWATPATDLWTASGNLLRPTATGTINEIQLIALTTNTGSLKFLSASNAGNTDTIITNASYGQASTLTIPDVGSSSGRFILSNSTGSQNIASALGINLTASSAVNITGSNILLHSATTLFASLSIDDAALNITSSGNPFFQLQWDDIHGGMVADSMNGLGGSAPWWINPKGGFVSIGLPTSETIVAPLQVANETDVQFIICGVTNVNQKALIGYSTSDDVFFIQGLNPTTTFSEVKLNPGGGNVSIGLSDGATAQSLLDVEADVYLADISTPGINPITGGKIYSKSGAPYWLNPSGVETPMLGSGSFSVVNATGANYTVLGTEDFIVGGNTGSNVNINIDQSVLTKPLIIQKLFNSLNLTITPAVGTLINGSGNPFTIPANGASLQGGLILVSGEDGQNIYITAGDFGTPNLSIGTTVASNGHTSKWVNLFTSNSSIAPGATAQFTATFDYQFPVGIFVSNVTVKEGTSGLPINAKIISQTQSNVVIEVQNMSAITTIGANTISLYVSAIGF